MRGAPTFEKFFSLGEPQEGGPRIGFVVGERFRISANAGGMKVVNRVVDCLPAAGTVSGGLVGKRRSGEASRTNGSACWPADPSLLDRLYARRQPRAPAG